MNRQKNRRRYQYRIEYMFDIPTAANALSLSTKISFQSNLEPEHLEIKGGLAILRFSRAERQNAQHAIKNERHLEVLNRIQCCYALEGLGVPTLRSIKLYEDNRSMEVKESDRPHLIPSLLRKSTATHQITWTPIPQELLPTLLSKDKNTHSSDALIASSYLIGSFSSESEVGRLRLLWSGFNAMYRTPSSEKYQTEAKLLSVVARSIKRGFFQRAESRYAQYLRQDAKLLDQLGWYKYARRKLLSDNKMNLYKDAFCSLAFADQFIFAAIKIDLYGKKAAEKKSIRLVDLSNSTSSNDKESSLLNRILSWAKSSDDNARGKPSRASTLRTSSIPDELAFLLSHYIYDLRCQYMHGENGYPLYSHPFTEKSLPWLNDILECALVDSIEMGLTEDTEKET